MAKTKLDIYFLALGFKRWFSFDRWPVYYKDLETSNEYILSVEVKVLYETNITIWARKNNRIRWAFDTSDNFHRFKNNRRFVNKLLFSETIPHYKLISIKKSIETILELF